MVTQCRAFRGVTVIVPQLGRRHSWSGSGARDGPINRSSLDDDDGDEREEHG